MSFILFVLLLKIPIPLYSSRINDYIAALGIPLLFSYRTHSSANDRFQKTGLLYRYLHVICSFSVAFTLNVA